MTIDPSYNIEFRDGGGATRTRPCIDLSGEGFGPFIPHSTLTNANGEPQGEGSPLHVAQSLAFPESAFARASNTVAYASGKIVTDSTGTSFTAGAPSLTAALAAGRSFSIPRVRLRKSGIVITNATFQVHLFVVAPTAIASDGANFAANGAAGYIGRTGDITMTALSDGAVGIGVSAVGATFYARSANGLLYWLLEARGAYAPVASEQFTLVPELVQN